MILCGWKGLIFGYMFGMEGDGREDGGRVVGTHTDFYLFIYLFFYMSYYLEGKTIYVEYLACPWSQSGR